MSEKDPRKMANCLLCQHCGITNTELVKMRLFPNKYEDDKVNVKCPEVDHKMDFRIITEGFCPRYKPTKTNQD